MTVTLQSQLVLLLMPRNIPCIVLLFDSSLSSIYGIFWVQYLLQLLMNSAFDTYGSQQASRLARISIGHLAVKRHKNIPQRLTLPDLTHKKRVVLIFVDKAKICHRFDR